MAAFRHQRFEPPDDRITREPPTRVGEIGNRLAVAQPELPHPFGSQPLGAQPGVGSKLFEPGPRRGSVGDERVYVHGVTLDDRITIATPEGLDVDLVLAGLGSRFVARLVDTLVQLGIIFALFIVALVISTGWFVAVVVVVNFLTIFVYDILFEVLASGRTPGKRVAGLRVVRNAGQPVGFLASAVRNVLRLVDFLPSLYLVGAISVVVSRYNQRLGDLAAGTVVVRERDARPQSAGWTSWSRPTVPLEAVAGWDVSAVTPAEVAAIRTFLDRRITLPPDARSRLGYDLAVRVGAKVSGIPASAHPEYVLEGVLVAKENRQ
jgi:uncharacterized RDD family membrane protein YckC